MCRLLGRHDSGDRAPLDVKPRRDSDFQLTAPDSCRISRQTAPSMYSLAQSDFCESLFDRELKVAQVRIPPQSVIEASRNLLAGHLHPRDILDRSIQMTLSIGSPARQEP